MTAVLRVVVDQPAARTDPELAAVSLQVARALVRTAPAGCEVEAVLAADADVDRIRAAVGDVGAVQRLPLARRELAAAWQLGMVGSAGGGMIHSPTLLAPLVRHDPVHDHDQTVVTIWDVPRDGTGSVWRRGMLRRAERFADAIVVPTHAAAERLAGRGGFGSRIRVIPGAAPARFAVTRDAVGRRRTLSIPEGTVLVDGASDVGDAFAAVVAASVDVPVVVVDVPDDAIAATADRAAAAGIRSTHLHVLGRLDDPADRAAVLDAAVVLLAPSRRGGFPWRAVEALTLGVPVIAAAGPDHDEVLGDGAVLVADAAAAGDALAAAFASTSALDRLSVLAADRGRSFSWEEHADRVWALHADV